MRAYLLLGVAALAACNVHQLNAVHVTAAQAQYPISMSDYIVVDETIVNRDQLDIVGQVKYDAPCVKPNATADISQAINDQVNAAGGQGVIGFGADVLATDKCQTVTFKGEIIKLRGAR
jgi:hypothetical protein